MLNISKIQSKSNSQIICKPFFLKKPLVISLIFYPLANKARMNQQDFGYFYSKLHGMDLLRKYFPALSNRQLEQFDALLPFYSEWNAKINLISRKDMDNFYERHVLHSLSIAKYVQFVAKTTILDVGTGGGFPGIPLAIFFPKAKFLLTDSIGKKIMVVQEAIQTLELDHVTAIKQRSEDVPYQFDFIVSRAVTTLPEFLGWTKNKILPRSFNQKPNGILYLKGGEIKTELESLPKRLVKNTQPISQWFNEPWFDSKYLIHLY